MSPAALRAASERAQWNIEMFRGLPGRHGDQIAQLERDHDALLAASRGEIGVLELSAAAKELLGIPAWGTYGT